MASDRGQNRYSDFVALLPCCSDCYFVNLLLCYLVPWLLCYPVALLPCYSFILFPCYSVTLLPWYFVALLPCYSVTWLPCCSVPLLLCCRFFKILVYSLHDKSQFFPRIDAFFGSKVLVEWFALQISVFARSNY